MGDLFRTDPTLWASVHSYLEGSLSVDAAALRAGQCRADGTCAAAPDVRVRTRLFDGRADVPLHLDAEGGVVRYERDGVLREAHAVRCEGAAAAALCAEALPAVARAPAGRRRADRGRHARARALPRHLRRRGGVARAQPRRVGRARCARLLCAHNRDGCPASLCRRDGAAGGCVPR